MFNSCNLPGGDCMTVAGVVVSGPGPWSHWSPAQPSVQWPAWPELLVLFLLVLVGL